MPEGEGIREQLLSVTQGNCRAAEYALELRMLVIGSGWNIPALKAAYHQGLNPAILTVLACRNEQKSLDTLNDH